MASSQALFDSWNWEAMSVASKILLGSGVTHCLIGSAALQLHGIYDNIHRRLEHPRGHARWCFANTFEVCLRDRDIKKAQQVLGQDGLFVTDGSSASEEYHTMYEGTGRLVKLRATFTSSKAVHLILLPQEDYFAVDGMICYLNVPKSPSVRDGNPSTPGRATSGGQLPVEMDMSTMLLSLLHRALAHHDHTVARCLSRMVLTGRKCAARPPTYWDEAVQARASKWLADRLLLDEDADETDATDETGRSQADDAGAGTDIFPPTPDYLAPVDSDMTMAPFSLDDLQPGLPGEGDEKEDAEMLVDAHDDECATGDVV